PPFALLRYKLNFPFACYPPCQELESLQLLCSKLRWLYNLLQKPIVQHISTRQLLSSDSGSKANGDAVLVVTFWLKYATVLPLRFTVCSLYHRLLELLIIHTTGHLVCHTPLISTSTFQHDERYRRCLHGAEERLVMK
ncbi:hypothetical protein K443DRAFT_112894, partial [Laccaria amethystina LaAM-08-1]